MQPYTGYGAYDDADENENEDDDHEDQDEEPAVDAEADEEESDDDEEDNGDGSDDEDEDEDEEQDGEGEDEEDEHDEDEDASGEDEDEEMAADGEDADDDGSTASHPSKPLPPHLQRRALFHPPFHPFTSQPAPSTFSVEALIAIPHPCATHSLALPSCSSMLLTGSADGHVRVYDLWASANGGMALTSAQKTATGLGEGVSKGGVARGWWVNAGAEDEDEDAEGEDDGEGDGVEKNKPAPIRKPEAVHSMVSQCDALWCLTGTQSGLINLTTLRHSPGTIVHTLKGHTGPVAALALSSDETALMSGGWDSTLKEWDLNTGQIVRTYPHLGTQLSSVSFRPLWPVPTLPAADSLPVSVAASAASAPADVHMADGDAESNASYDPLFDDADDDVPPPAPSTILAGSGTPGLSFPAPGSGVNPKLALPGVNTTPQKALALPNGSAPKFAAAAVPSVPVARTAPALAPLSPTSYRAFSDDVILTSAMDGNVVLVDRRAKSYESGGVGRLLPGDKAPPWCMSATWSADGTQVFAGRRNGTIDIWDVRRSLASSTSTTPNLLMSLRTPAESGPVSAVVAFPDGKHMACGSQDNIRLWNPAQIMRDEQSSFAGKKKSSRPPFKIIAGHHGGIVSALVVDPTNRFLVSASGDRGWQGESTKVVLVHEIKW